MQTIHVAGVSGAGRDVRAAIEGENVTLEWRYDEAWHPLTIADLRGVLSARNGIIPWLEDLGVLWGAWVGRGPDEIATFGRSIEAVARPKRQRRSPAFRVTSARTRVA